MCTRKLSKFANHLIKSKTTYACLDKAVFALFGFIYFIYFARILSKQEFGTFALFDAIKVLTIIICDMSISQAVIFYGAGLDNKKFYKLFKNAQVLKISISAIIFVFCLVAIFIFKKYLNGSNIFNYALCVSLMHFTTLISNIPTSLYTAKESYKNLFYYDFSALILLCGTIFIARSYISISTAFGSVLLISIVKILVFIFWLIFKDKKFIFNNSIIDISTFKKLFSYSKSSVANSLGVLAFSKTDLFMLGIFSGPEAVGLYAKCTVFLSFFRVVNEPFSMMALPKISKLGRNEVLKNLGVFRERLSEIFFRSAYSSLFLTFPLILLMIIIPNFVLKLLFQYSDNNSQSIVVLFAFWGLILPFFRIGATILNGLGMPNLNARITWGGAIINIIMNFPLIINFGAKGAALSSLLTTIFVFTIYATILYKRYGIIFLFDTKKIKGMCYEFNCFYCGWIRIWKDLFSKKNRTQY